ncbi:N-acetylmuramoyl-L-alanine amidase, partial [bacterium]|nr:N-acetylmuramoyl-L-alanine amidase [bacterium]
AVEAARLENSVIKLEESPQKYPHLEDEQFILSSMAQSEFTRESEQLAAAVQNNTSRLSGLRDRGVKQGDYYVLIGASMPNILFETAFISNPAEERKLKTSAFQKKIAKGIFEGIKDFKSLYDAH